MRELIETTILYLMLVAFALYGVLYLAPSVSKALQQKLITASQAK